MREFKRKAVSFIIAAATMFAPTLVFADEAAGTAELMEQNIRNELITNESTGADASSYMHADITSNMDTYESGTTAIVSVKYTLDQDSIHQGDYVIVTVPSDIASNVSFSLNSQHFSGYENLGNGQYKLTFASNIESGLSGSFNAYVTTNTVEKTTPGTISVGYASKKITVVPGGSPSGTGTYTDTIMKDAAENDNVQYGGYDYSDGSGDGAAQIGIADLSNGGTYKYRLYVNDKQGEISNVTVIDRIPDGMTINREKGVEVTDRFLGKSIDSSLYSVEYESQSLIFKYPGTFSNTIQINYWVDIPAGSNTSKYTNTATITYTQNNETHQEHRNYVLQGAENNASNGEKSVDKSIISTDPDDQFVTYTIKFWNSNGFAAGEINLTDQLDSHVIFVGADTNEYFSVEKDSTDPQKIKITNTKAIDGSKTTYVRFTVDMSKVPVGYTVKNTVGGNTTKTTKYGGGLTLIASKLVNDKKDGISKGQFSFQLLSDNGEVLQDKSNDAEGNVSFDTISYTPDDVGKTFTYQVKEIAGKDNAYQYDQRIYTVTVKPALELDSNRNPTGKILADPAITSNDGTADRIVFNNTANTGSLKLTKVSEGHDTPSSAEFVITGPDRFSRTEMYSSFKDGSMTLENIPVGTYTVKESNAGVEGYTLTVDGSTTAEVAKDSTAEIKLTNTYTLKTSAKISIPVSKVWSGGTGSKAVVHLFADGSEVKTVELNAGNNWQYTFENLEKYKDGNEISYTLAEDSILGYSSVITYSAESGFTVTNTKDSEGHSSGGNGAVRLYKVDSQTGASLAGAQFALYRSNGGYIGTYSTDSTGYLNVQNLSYGSYYFVETKAPEGYELDSDRVSFTLDQEHSAGNAVPWNIKVSNTKSGVTSVKIGGTKIWEDNNNADKTRPSVITLHLLANGKEIAATETSADLNWVYSFGIQPLYDASGKEITYTVAEDLVSNYTFSQDIPVTSDDNMVINVKNTLTLGGSKKNEVSKDDTGGSVSYTGAKTAEKTSVKTGYDSHVMFYLILFIGSIAALINCIVFARKHKDGTE